MSEANVEAIRGVYERWRKGEFAASIDVLDPHAVFVLPPGFPDAGRYEGVGQIEDYTRGFLEPWDRITIEAEELAASGDRVFAAVLQRGVGTESGAATEFRYFQVWSFRDGSVIRLENFREREEAMAATASPGGSAGGRR